MHIQAMQLALSVSVAECTVTGLLFLSCTSRASLWADAISSCRVGSSIFVRLKAGR